MLEGRIISCVSNLYQVQVENKIIECNARGKFKQCEISPVVGDFVKIELLENEERQRGYLRNFTKNYV